MHTKLISKLTVSCSSCGTTITCNIVSQFRKTVECPICGESLEGNFDYALKTALAFNKAAMDVIQCQKECDVTFCE